MTTIRPLQHEDVPEVAHLYSAYLASPRIADLDELTASLARIFAEGPLHDPEIPSLVAENGGGRIVGFIGSLVHPMCLGDERIRLACSSSLVVTPDARRNAVGAFLLRKYLSGAQDLTITDTAGQDTETMWLRLGGSKLHLQSIAWLLPIAPLRAALVLGVLGSRAHSLLPFVRPLFMPIDLVLARVMRPVSTEGAERLSEETLTSSALRDSIETGAPDVELRPAYAAAELDRQLAEMARTRSRGSLVRHVVREPSGRVVGIYIASLLPNDIFDVVHAMPRRGMGRQLLMQIATKARDLNAAAVRSRLDPWLLDVLPRRSVMYSRDRFLYHSRTTAVRDAVRTGNALITGLQGDAWLPT